MRARRCSVGLVVVVLTFGAAARAAGASPSTHATAIRSVPGKKKPKSKSTTTTTTTVKTATGVDLTLSGAIAGKFVVSGAVTCATPSADGVLATAQGSVGGAPYTLAIQVFDQNAPAQTVTFPTATASVRVFNQEGSRLKDSWAAGRPGNGAGTMVLTGGAPRTFGVNATLWKVDTATGQSADNSATNVTVQGKVTCHA